MHIHQILSTTNEELDCLDMSYYPTKYKDSHSSEYSQYFQYMSGKDHYRLLTKISSIFEGQTLIDIGTFDGWSSIALGSNKKTRVISFDIISQPCISSISEPNIEYRVENIMEGDANRELIKQSPFIMLDTYHDGTFEKQFFDGLISMKYKGIVMFDDIYLNSSMISFWESISVRKYDITRIGHYTGTGILVFE